MWPCCKEKTGYFKLELSEISLIRLAHGIPASGGGTWRDGRQVTSGYSFSDWWLLTDPCDCDWQALTTTPLALASPHCWAQQVVWRLAEIPNKMDITGKNNSRPRGGECWARSTPPSHSVPGFTNSAPFQDCGISGKHLIEKAVVFSDMLFGRSRGQPNKGERQRTAVRLCGAAAVNDSVCIQKLHIFLLNKAGKATCSLFSAGIAVKIAVCK